MFLNQIDKSLSYLVSNYDILKKLKGYNIQCIVYSDLNKFNSILELLPNSKQSVFILIRSSASSGHWTSLTRNGNKLTYFDSYGIGPDGELVHIDTQTRIQLFEDKPILSELLKQRPKEFQLEFNKTHLQHYGKLNNVEINTCGKYNCVIVKLLLNDISLKQFQERMKNIHDKTKLTYDEIISLIYDVI